MFAALTADLRHMTGAWDAPAGRVWLRAAPRLLAQGRFRTILFFRLSQAAHRHRLTILALWLQSRGQRASGAELHPAAVIGPGLNVAHGGGIVVGHEVVAGRDLVLYQNVTLGHRRGGEGWGGGQPHLGEGVRIYAGAVLLGPIRVGDGAVIGANATVLADVPAGQKVQGIWK